MFKFGFPLYELQASRLSRQSISNLLEGVSGKNGIVRVLLQMQL